MELDELEDLIFDLGIDATKTQLNLLFKEFERDFIDDEFYIDGLKVKVILEKSDVVGYEDYPETFVHLITRKANNGKRVFDKFRANKIHWVKCILENKENEDIIYFEYPDKDQIIKDYFWYKEGDFLVIMKKVLPDYIIISSFHIDNKRNRDYYENKLQWYLKNR